jgi:hypothetical protein
LSEVQAFCHVAGLYQSLQTNNQEF